MIRTILCILVIHLTFLSGNAQDLEDFVPWYIMKPGEVDKNASENHIQTILVYQRDSLGEKLLNKRLYDQKGFLVHRVDYSLQNKLDSFETFIKRVSLKEIVVEYKFIARGEYDNSDGQCPRTFLGAYFNTLSANNYSVLTKSYKRTSGDTTISVITSINGIVKRSYSFTLMNTTIKQEVTGDTTYIYDTLIISRQVKDSLGNRGGLKTYFKKGIPDPVKIEEYRYVYDSMAYYKVEINEYDKKRRLVNHSVYQGPPLMQFENKRIIYDDVTGEWTQLNDNYPTSGTPQLIWRYDKKGRILYYERVGIFGRDKGSVVYKYNEKGLLIEKIFSVNDVPVEYTLYEYRYY